MQKKEITKKIKRNAAVILLGILFLCGCAKTENLTDSPYSMEDDKKAGDEIYYSCEEILITNPDRDLIWELENKEEIIREEAGKLYIKKADQTEVAIPKPKDFNTFMLTAAWKDDSLYLASEQGVYKVENNEPKLLFPLSPDYILETIYQLQVSDNENIDLLCSMEYEVTRLKLTKTDTPINQAREEIVLSMVFRNDALEKSVARFNRQSDQYRVKIVLADEDVDIRTARERIVRQITGGGGPDILAEDLFFDVDMEDFARNGYLECLDDIRPDSEDYFQAAFDSCLINGKSYGIPIDFTLDLVFYNPKLEGLDVKNWTVEEMMQQVENSDVEEFVYDRYGQATSPYYLVMKFGLRDESNKAYIDWEKGESHLDEAPFIRLMEFAKKYGAPKVSVSTFPVNKFQEGKIFGGRMNIECLDDWSYIYEEITDEPVILGYPRQDGNGYYVDGREFYVNANSKCKEGAKAFLSFIITKEEQKRFCRYDVDEEREYMTVGQCIYGMSYFPVCKDAMEVVMERKRKIDQKRKKDEEIGNYTYWGDKLHHFVAMDEEQQKQFLDIIDHARPGCFKADALQDIIYEELQPYFEGSVSAEEVAGKLHERVQLYLNEQK